MKDDPNKLTDEDIVRLAQTFRKPLPDGLEADLWAKLDAIDKAKEPQPEAKPARNPFIDPSPFEDPDYAPGPDSETQPDADKDADIEE